MKPRSPQLGDCLTIGAILIGSALRVHHFGHRGAFWGDEAALAANLIARSYGQLAQPLDLWQAAPVGYLLLEKGLGSLGGMDETVFRLPSLLAGIATLVIAGVAVRSSLGPVAATVASVLLAFSPELIRYSGEFKPYALDAAISIGLFAWFARGDRPDRRQDAWLLALAGVAAPWFSLPSVFVLAGCGGCLIWQAAIEGHRHQFLLRALMAAFWVASFAVEYRLCLRATSQTAELVNYWSAAFAPLPPRSFADLRWYAAKAIYLFEPVVGLRPRHLALVLFGIGCGWLWFRDRRLVSWIAATTTAVLLASALRKYPFTGRLILFLMPLLILPIAVCFAALFRRARRPWSGVGLILLGLLVWQPADLAVTRIAQDQRAEDTKSRTVAMYQAMRDHYRPGDRFLVGWEADWSFRYYSQRYQFAPAPITYLATRPDLRAEWVRQWPWPPRSRTWLFFSVSSAQLPASESRLLTDQLPSAVPLIFDRTDEGLGFALRCYEMP